MTHQPTRRELLTALRNFILIMIFVFMVIMALTGCNENPAEVKHQVTTQQSGNHIQILWYDSTNTNFRYEGPFENYQQGFQTIFLYRKGFDELQVPVDHVISVNIDPQ